VYPVTFSQSESRPNERRRNPRHRASSIIYAQLGSDNGGVVVNLGINGVAFHTARELTAERNSTLHLRLRGSGLNVDLAGEVVWLGAAQKEVGIRFKNPSTKSQQDIAVWIARDAQLFETVALEDWPQPKPMAAMPRIPATGEKSAPPSPAALAKSQAMPADTPSSADANVNKSRSPASLFSAPGIIGATPLLEIVSPIQQGNNPSDELDDHLRGHKADLFASPKDGQVEQHAHDEALFEPISIERPYQFPASYVSPRVPSEEPMPPAREEQPQASAAPPVKSEPRKTGKIGPIHQVRLPRPPDRLVETTAAERWIPPAVLAAWRRGNLQQKLLLGSAAAVCVGFFMLMLTLALARVDSSIGRSAGSESPQQPPAQQSTTPPPAPSVSVLTPQTGLIEAPLPPPATSPPRSHRRPQPSAFANFVKTFFGFDLDNSDAGTEIDEDQLRVQVWTSKSSGYYYCTDDEFYKNVQPGSFMSQGDALQSGYRSRLGQFCD
jgi:hypothetical protein